MALIGLLLPSISFAQCPDLELQLQVQVGENFNQGIPNKEIFLQTQSDKISLGRTDREGSLKVSKTHILNLSSDPTFLVRFKDEFNPAFRWSLKHEELEDFIQVRTFFRVKELFAFESCKPLSLTRSEYILNRNIIRNAVSSMWAIEAGERFLHRHGIEARNKSARLTHIQLKTDPKTNSFATRGQGNSNLIHLNLNDSRQVFVALHEMGHVLMFDYFGWIWKGGAHTSSKCYDRELSLSEGWANFFAALVLQENFPGFSLDWLEYHDHFLSHNAKEEIGTLLVNCHPSNNARLVAGLLMGVHHEFDLSLPMMWDAFQSKLMAGKLNSLEGALIRLRGQLRWEERGAFDSYLGRNGLSLGFEYAWFNRISPFKSDSTESMASSD